MNNISRFATILLYLFIFSTVCFSQAKPEWVKNTPHITLDNSRIAVYTGTGDSETQAFNAATQMLLADQSFGTGFWTNVNVQPNGDFAATGSDEVKVKAKRLDYYHEERKGVHHVYILMQIATKPSYDFERVNVTRNYNLIGESFIPGMAQIKKGQMGKGVFFIAAEALCVSGIIIGESQRTSCISKMNNTRDAKLKRSYKNQSNNWATARNIAIAGTATFYVWNVIDGIMAKGKKHIKIGNMDVALAPYYIPESFNTPESSGLAMHINF